MKRTLVVFVLLAMATVFAQNNKNPVTSVVKQILPHQQKNLVAAAEEMPADKFGFRPTPEQMTFGNLVLHIIQSNSYLCAKIGEIPEAKLPGLKETDGKDRLVTALKASFDFCSTALGKVDDSKLGDTVELGGGREGPRAFALIALTNDWADHYSAAAMYLRLNGLLPANGTRKEVKSGTAKREIDFKGGITASNPFRPLPIDFKGPYLALRLRFYYNPDPSLLAPNRAIWRKHRPSRQCWLWLELVSVCTLL